MTRRRIGWLTAAALVLLAAGALSVAGCANLGYYWQSASGHLALMRAAKPVDDWLADPSTSAALKTKLAETKKIRRYASKELGLPDNASYTAFADLHRKAAVWNVVAAPPFSLTLKTWCFPVAGCVGYRGYYSEADALAEAERQRAEGLEAAVYPVPAYSTLGWTNWLGGDPLLSTFIGYPDGELARLIFHELAHQVLYVPGDTLFNESYATAVERIGAAKWLAAEGTPAMRADYEAFDERRREFRQLSLETRQRLEQVYTSKEAAAHDQPALTAMKNAAMSDFRARYDTLRSTWPAKYQHGYDAWVAQANNALFGAQAAYDALVPAFENLFAEKALKPGDPWPRFYAAVKKIAALPDGERKQALLAIPAAPAAAVTENIPQAPTARIDPPAPAVAPRKESSGV